MNSDDPKLTAYALGELSGEEAIEFERMLADDEGLREALKEIQETAGMVRVALGDESASILTTKEEDQMIATAIEGDEEPEAKMVRVPFYRNPAYMSLAAALVMIFGLLGLITSMSIPAYNKDKPTVHVVDTKKPRVVRHLMEPTPPPALSANELNSSRDQQFAYSTQQKVAGLDKNKSRKESGAVIEKGIRTRASLSEIESQLARGNEDSMSLTMSSEPKILPPETPISYEPITPVRDGEFNTEAYDSIEDNSFLLVEHSPLSTFSIDVDSAAYANVRRFINARQRPPKDAVRIEELVNYFPYEYALAERNEHPLKINVEAASAPWQEEHRLVRVALKGKEIDWEERPASNVVFLLDVSGSMQSQNKLPLVKQSVELLVRKFGQRDRVAIVTYAGQSRVALPSTTADNTETILHAIGNLTSGGSTLASAGIEDAYKIAEKHFVDGGNNRVILCTDGDFNVGVTNRGSLVDLIEKEANNGVYLTILGFGIGNYKDATLEELSNKGNGNYGYIDTLREARKVFVEQVAGTMVTIAKDVKIQVEFNPAKVQAYRLIGYENRRLAAQDFNDDKKDAGEIGAGHTVTAFYEVVPAGMDWEAPGVDPLKYQKPVPKLEATSSDELLTVKLRYKLPEADESTFLEEPFVDTGNAFAKASEDFRFAAGVAAFGMILRDSPYKGNSGFALVREIAEGAQGNNRGGYRSEFLHLIDQAEMVLAIKLPL